jgi:hypothetical protein
VIRAQTLRNFVFVACTPLQQTHRGYTGQQPGQLRNLRHIGLSPENGFFGIETQSDIIHCNVKSMTGDLVRRGVARKGMIVGNEIKRIMLRLQLQVLTHGPEKVAYMKFA